MVDERAVIIQAKITGNKLHLPKVTITSGDSSKKEFDLYRKMAFVHVQEKEWLHSFV